MEGQLDVPKHPARRVHDLYFNPQLEEIRTTNDMDSLQCVHECVQERSHPSVQDNCEASVVP
jgi:hypothetical protein